MALRVVARSWCRTATAAIASNSPRYPSHSDALELPRHCSNQYILSDCVRKIPLLSTNYFARAVLWAMASIPCFFELPLVLGGAVLAFSSCVGRPHASPHAHAGLRLRSAPHPLSPIPLPAVSLILAVPYATPIPLPTAATLTLAVPHASIIYFVAALRGEQWVPLPRPVEPKAGPKAKLNKAPDKPPPRLPGGPERAAPRLPGSGGSSADKYAEPRRPVVAAKPRPAPKPRQADKFADWPWESARDPASGDIYYINTKTDETTWDKPPMWDEVRLRPPLCIITCPRHHPPIVTPPSLFSSFDSPLNPFYSPWLPVVDGHSGPRQQSMSARNLDRSLSIVAGSR